MLRPPGLRLYQLYTSFITAAVMMIGLPSTEKRHRMRKIRAWLAVPVLTAAMIVPSGGEGGHTANAAQASGAQRASSSTDVYEELDDAPFCNHIGACGYATLWLNLNTGDLHAEVSSEGHQPIPGSEVKLQVSGYEDFRNVAHTWPAWVPESGPNDWLANSPDVPWNALGVGYWWNASGYIGSGDGFTMNWKVTKTQSGWDIQRYPPE